jgi:hypothetical protein
VTLFWSQLFGVALLVALFPVERELWVADLEPGRKALKTAAMRSGRARECAALVFP